MAVRGEVASGTRAKVEDGGSPYLHYLRYGATLGGFVDIYHQRVFGLSLIADFVDPLAAESAIPFTELVALGGSRPMRGFLPNRLLGRSSAVARLEYRWPIWVFLDGLAHYELGNVFGKQLEDFDAELLRQSVGFGFRANSSRDHTFEMLLGFGTETFADGSEVDSIRFVFGATEGF
jgi:outer membrane protein assembly factor BamA